MVDINQIINYVNKNKISAKSGVICVDGRYKKGEDTAGFLARPGANFRDIMVLLALNDRINLSVEEIVDLVINLVTEVQSNFIMHTDHHSIIDSYESIGCGHIAKAMNHDFSSMYKVNPDDVKMALRLTRQKLNGSNGFIFTNLEGEHKEKAILVNTGISNSVNHWDYESDEMYFVYDQTREAEFNKKLFDSMNLNNISFEEYQEVANLQLQSTLHNLAKGLEIFEVNADDEIISVKKIGIVD